MQPLCAKCLIKRPNYDKVITIFRYNYIIKKIISDLKYRDKFYIAKKIAKILAPKINDIIANDDILVPVPLHFKKLQERRFNQSLLICLELMNLLNNKPKLVRDLIFRVKNTKIQAKLRGQERLSNVKKAFIVNKKYLDLIKDKTILLLDDIITTGATAENCAKILKKKGAKRVVVISLAKT